MSVQFEKKSKERKLQYTGTISKSQNQQLLFVFSVFLKRVSLLEILTMKRFFIMKVLAE